MKELNVLKIAPNRQAVKNPKSGFGKTFDTNVGYARSIFFNPSPKIWKEINPGTFSNTGKNNKNTPAYKIPFCPSARLFAARDL